MSDNLEQENIENVEEVEVIPTDKQENVEETTGEVSGEVSGEVTEPKDNSNSDKSLFN
jgi:hypothetical protein